MHTLSIDLETYSDVDIKVSGVYPYVETNAFEILLFAYACDNDPVICLDLTKEAIPDNLIRAIFDPAVVKTAFNANFEITCLSKHLGIELDASQWDCTMVRSLMLGLPGSLEMAAKVLKLPAQKDQSGAILIRYFSKPCKPTKANGERERNLPEHAPERWAEFKSYCIQDVEVERAIRNKLLQHGTVPDQERALWLLDQEINRRGVLVDRSHINHAMTCDAWYTEQLVERAKALTQLDNPNSLPQLKSWLQSQTGIPVKSLRKDDIPDYLEAVKQSGCEGVGEVIQMLKIRKEMAKTSVKKYAAMQNAVCRDNRIRGLLAYYGANRTGRWSGRLVQIQNLPQNKYEDLDLARQLLNEGAYEDIVMLYDSVPNVLSQLIRTAFIPKEGCQFLVADFSAIEARVIAWLADETWRLDVFNSHGKIYEASASQMFKVPIESITKGNPLRQKGKIAELALGYGGGAGALEQMGALKMGIAEDELQGLVGSWREANPNITALWRTVNAAALKAVGKHETVKLQHGLVLEYRGGILFIRLPSGRKLSYINAKLGTGNMYGNTLVTYQGVNQTSKQWETQKTYGGKLVENIVQAIARDCLAYSMMQVAASGYQIVMHVHDEIIVEHPIDDTSLDKICEIMGQPIPWAEGLPLRADGYVTPYYKKD